MPNYPAIGSLGWGPAVQHENTKARYGSPPIDSRADVDRFIAPNAAAKLAISTGIGDPNNEVVEPSVWYDPNGLFGYEYWMAAGPYQNSNNAVENPSVWCSHDGQTWVVPPGGSNPVVPAPGAGNYDDPHLYELGGTLYLVWNWNTATNDQVLMRSTTDGITWSATTSLRTGTSGTQGEFVSPHIEYQNGLWYMWTLNRQGTRTIYLSTATSLTGTWSAPTACVTPLPSGRDHWEFEVRRVGSEWWMLQCVVVPGGTSSGGQLRLRTSTDGINWTMSRRPVLTANPLNPSGFDGNFIYKPSFVPLADGRMAIWYSAGSGGTLRWSIGYTIAEPPRASKVNSTYWYAPPTGVTTGTITSGTAYYLPLYLDKAVSLSAIGLEVTSAGSVGSTIELGIYDDYGWNLPGQLIVDAGAINGTSATFQSLSITQTVGPGIIWLAVLPLGAPTTPPTVRVANSPSIPIGSTTTSLISANNLAGHRQTGLSALPALASANPSLASGTVPRPIYQAT